MKLPSKITSYKESVLSKIPDIMSILIQGDISILTLYEKTKDSFINIEEFLDVLDCLYAINKIELKDNREIHYVN